MPAARPTRRSRRAFLGAAASTLALATLGAACGDDDEEPDETPTARSEPLQGGIARYPLVGTNSGDPPSLFPYENLTYLAQHPAALQYSRLLKGAAAPGISPNDTTTLEGDLSGGLPEQPDTLTYLFRLRDNLRFHDKPPLDGREVTARDVLASYETFIATSSNAGGWTQIIESADAPDDRTFRVRLKTPFAPFLTTHASSPDAFWFIPVESIAGGQAQTSPVGTGPFVFRQYEEGVALRWDRNPAWHVPGKPYVDGIETSLSGDPQRIVAALASGELDWSHFDAPFFPSVREQASSDGEFVFEAAGNLGGIFFNFDNPPFQDARIRRALSMALDRAGILGLVDPTARGDWHSHLPPALVPHFISPRDEAAFGPSARYFQRDLAEVKLLLDSAGYPDGLDFTLYANVDRYGAAFQQLWEAIQSSLAEANIRAELVYQEYGAYIETTFRGDIPEGGAAVGPFVGSPRDPDNIFFTVYSSASPRKNWGGAPIPEQRELDLLFSQQRAIYDPNQRTLAIADIQRRMAESMLVVPYVAPALFKYVQPWVVGLYPKAGYGWHGESVPAASFTDERLDR